ncbi:MAG: hypothetical protein MUF54_21745 [Polyangiaceae bacterium]|jgi:hypothetical protein|nr:hypothetical protein [Polyangiaceae bacterium]
MRCSPASAPYLCAALARRIRGPLLACTLVAFCSTHACKCSRPSAGPARQASLLRKIADPAVAEPSGLVRSRRYPGVFWTHGDSGNKPWIFAISSEGRYIAKVEVEGASAVDWEDIAVDDAGNLYIADTGNNENRRRDLAVFQIPEPDPFGSATSVRAARTYRFRYASQVAYPDPHQLNYDAEALFWARGSLYLLSKHRSDLKTSLYRIPDEAAQQEVALTPLSTFELGGAPLRYCGMATAADATDDGRFLAVLTYHALFVFERPVDSDDYLKRPVARVDFDQDQMQQCESVAWDGWSIIVGNEAGALWRVYDPFSRSTAIFP